MIKDLDSRQSGSESIGGHAKQYAWSRRFSGKPDDFRVNDVDGSAHIKARTEPTPAPREWPVIIKSVEDIQLYANVEQAERNTHCNPY